MGYPHLSKEKLLLGAAALLVGTLIAQTSVVALSILSIAKGINIPLLLEKASSNGATTFKATPLLILLSYAISAIIIRYGSAGLSKVR
ncbi:hypothetical protein [Thermococcus sp. 2319x1]|uniref:hypothetical protein n=1 Tax=Thermococcus sp. 2319x1 TaxID=1674923 RepID=UPI00158307EC|nr:hypothetical protein [Thermococcus sp. 2319x1]